MKIRILLAAAVCLPAAFGAYTYAYPNLLNPYSSGQWVINGSGSGSTNMYTSSDAFTGGALIWGGGSLSTPKNYEVRTTLALTSSGGSYITYLRADNSSILASGNNGTFNAAELANP